MTVQAACNQLITSYPTNLEGPVQTITEHFPLLLEVIRGQIGHFKIENHRFAHWDWQDKTLYLSAEEEEESDQIQTYLFELHNAAHTSKFKDLGEQEETLGADAYVQEFEEVEYASAKFTQTRLEILADSFEFDLDQSTFKALYPSFELHYLFQQIAGHSQIIADRYQKRHPTMPPYKGTWKFPLDPQSKKLLKNALIGHLHTIFYEDTELLDETLDTLRQGLKNRESWATSAQKNLRFFNEQLAKHASNIEPIRI